MNSLKERFRILIEGGVVAPEAADIAQRAVERLTATHGRFPEDRVNMFSTHLASALTRLERCEEIEPPPKELFAEVEASPWLQEAVGEVEWIERQWGKALPDAEKRFLTIHYVSLLQEMEGEET
ncbi:PRD domain-containing protein [Planifilum fimeticola]|uniref:PRD domain-containing protein n=1 Tax=Planifilum fimeticola TaxID=201975 RepID=A0A2T0LAP2_9BACL|nr:PRD domain-containing protein [Planifilum fimeticola]PRX38870.1 PRD domain-containing protein [Planifilum fimeticola]